MSINLEKRSPMTPCPLPGAVVEKRSSSEDVVTPSSMHKEYPKISQDFAAYEIKQAVRASMNTEREVPEKEKTSSVEETAQVEEKKNDLLLQKVTQFSRMIIGENHSEVSSQSQSRENAYRVNGATETNTQEPLLKELNTEEIARNALIAKNAEKIKQLLEDDCQCKCALQ